MVIMKASVTYVRVCVFDVFFNFWYRSLCIHCNYFAILVFALIDGYPVVTESFLLSNFYKKTTYVVFGNLGQEYKNCLLNLNFKETLKKNFQWFRAQCVSLLVRIFQRLYSMAGQMNTVLNPSPDDSDTEAILIVEDSETVTLTKLQKAVYELQKNTDTFVKDPDEILAKKFECWLEIIDDQLSEERINKHLKSSIVLRNQYEKLVPEIVPHSLFWKRYLFKKALLEDDIAHQEAMEKKEKKEKAMNADAVKWEQDFAPYIELTEEEQIKLLQEYENEIKNKEIPVDSSNKDKEIRSSTIPDACDNNSKIINLQQEMRCSEKKINKIDSAISLETTSSNSSTDGEWEKISDVDK